MTPYHPHQAIAAQVPMSQTPGDKFHHNIPVTILQPNGSLLFLNFGVLPANVGRFHKGLRYSSSHRGLL